MRVCSLSMHNGASNLKTMHARKEIWVCVMGFPMEPQGLWYPQTIKKVQRTECLTSRASFEFPALLNEE